MKNIVRPILAATLACFGASAFSQANTVVSASGFTTLANQMCFTGTDVNNNVITYTPAGGSPISTPQCFAMSGGALTGGGASVANGNTVSPQPLFYRIQLINGSKVYLTLLQVQISGSSYSMNSYAVPASGYAVGTGSPAIACTAGAKFSSTTLAPGRNYFTCSTSGTWQTYPTGPFCGPNQGQLASQANGTQMCIASETEGSGAPSGICTEKQKYFQTDASAGSYLWGCINGSWSQITTGPAGPAGPPGVDGQVTNAALATAISAALPTPRNLLNPLNVSSGVIFTPGAPPIWGANDFVAFSVQVLGVPEIVTNVTIYNHGGYSYDFLDVNGSHLSSGSSSGDISIGTPVTIPTGAATILFFTQQPPTPIITAANQVMVIEGATLPTGLILFGYDSTGSTQEIASSFVQSPRNLLNPLNVSSGVITSASTSTFVPNLIPDFNVGHAQYISMLINVLGISKATFNVPIYNHGGYGYQLLDVNLNQTAYVSTGTDIAPGSAVTVPSGTHYIAAFFQAQSSTVNVTTSSQVAAYAGTTAPDSGLFAPLTVSAVQQVQNLIASTQYSPANLLKPQNVSSGVITSSAFSTFVPGLVPDFDTGHGLFISCLADVTGIDYINANVPIYNHGGYGYQLLDSNLNQVQFVSTGTDIPAWTTIHIPYGVSKIAFFIQASVLLQGANVGRASQIGVYAGLYLGSPVVNQLTPPAHPVSLTMYGHNFLWFGDSISSDRLVDGSSSVFVSRPLVHGTMAALGSNLVLASTLPGRAMSQIFADFGGSPGWTGNPPTPIGSYNGKTLAQWLALSDTVVVFLGT